MRVPPPTRCPLCDGVEICELFEANGRTFFECIDCDILLASATSKLTHAEELNRYQRHNNAADNTGYIAYLSKLTQQLIPHLTPAARGLDFGSGPTVILSTILEQQGFLVQNYDPFFGPALNENLAPFDFITCCETAEHFEFPTREFKLMNSIVKPGGFIAIMTNLREGERRSAAWWYLRDVTHRCFYSRKTFEFLATSISWDLISILDDVIIFKRRSVSSLRLV